MCMPFVAARVEKSGRFLAARIERHLLLIFMAVAGMAGERQIIKIITAAEDARHDMIYRRAVIEQGFRRMAIFAAIACPGCDNFVEVGCHGPLQTYFFRRVVFTAEDFLRREVFKKVTALRFSNFPRSSKSPACSCCASSLAYAIAASNSA